MKRALGWMMVAGLGAALATGCVSRQEEDAQQVGKPYTPIQQKYKSPGGPAAESGVGGSGQTQSNDQVAMPENWRAHPDTSGNEDLTGAYGFSRPQPVPRERRPAPLGTSRTTDFATQMAKEQLESY